jgi:hypothetical protein
MAQGEGRETSAAESKRRLSTDVSDASHQRLSRLKAEWGLRSRGAVIDRLLLDLFQGSVDEDIGAQSLTADSVTVGGQIGVTSAPDPAVLESFQNQGNVQEQGVGKSEAANLDTLKHGAKVSRRDDGEEKTIAGATTEVQQSIGMVDVDSAANLEPHHSPFTETGALVLVQREGTLEASLEFDEQSIIRPRNQARRGGIDLPGFVRRNSAQLRRSLNPPSREQLSQGDVLPSLAEPELVEALATASDHWLSLYGQPANEAVLEASMTWLAHDIWTQSDQSEGEAFTWTLAQRMISTCAPSWQEGPPTLERVIVLAGLLEDPFSASTLSLRIPTLIRRFVHRFRRRKGASFQTLEHTMTLHGALKVLQIPIDSGQRLTLPLIRDAYHELAMNHHPDAGGSVEMMRRLNEAYQLLKELYRNKES